MDNYLFNKKKKHYAKKIFFVFLLIIIFFIFYFFVTLNKQNSNNTATKEFIVASGQGSTKIAQQLKREGLIPSALVFELYVWQQGISSRLKDGNYFLAQNLSIKQVADILYRGAGVTKEKTLTFIEGWNNNQYASYLLNESIIKKETEFFDVVQRKAAWWDDYDVLKDKPRNLDLEGYLFPDTYRIYSDASAQDVVKKMLDNLSSKINADLRAEIKRQGKTIHEILTMASILEKEISCEKPDHFKDCAMVADIFYKRLDIGMALQADSTVNYATGKSDSRSTSVDTQIDSPYNTYKYKGLPPGPIANPGISAIKAAVYLQKNDYYYFLTTPDGQVIYSKTHEQHVAAKAKYYK